MLCISLLQQWPSWLNSARAHVVQQGVCVLAGLQCQEPSNTHTQNKNLRRRRKRDLYFICVFPFNGVLCQTLYVTQFLPRYLVRTNSQPIPKLRGSMTRWVIQRHCCLLFRGATFQRVPARIRSRRTWRSHSWPVNTHLFFWRVCVCF